MAYRVLEVTVQSAKDLRKVNLMTRMEVYAVATISGDPITRQCTPPDPYGSRNPTWNATLRFAIPPDSGSASSGCLHVLLRTARSLGDRDVGEVIVPLSDILRSSAGPHGSPQSASYQVRKVHRAEARGVLHLSFRLGPVLAPQHHHQQQQQQQQQPAPRPSVDEEQHVVAYPAVPRPFYPQPYAYYLPQALLPPSPRTSPSPYMALPAPPLPPSPRAYDHMDLPPPPPPLHKAYNNGHLSMPPPPPAVTPQPSPGHKAAPATPPSKASSGYASAAASPAWTPHPKASGYASAAASPWATTPTATKNSGGSEFGAEAPTAGGRMMSNDMMAEAAAYNAGYRAALAADWRGGVY